MTFGSFFGKVRRKILQLFLGKNIYEGIESVCKLENHLAGLDKNLLSNLPRQINELKEQNNALSYELWKTKTLLLLKEQSPELLHRFASGLCNDDGIIDSLSQSYIFNDLRNDFVNNMGIITQKFVCGAPRLSLNKINENQWNIAKNPLYKRLIFSNILSVFMLHYENDEIAYKLDELFDWSFLDEDTFGTLQYILWLLLRKEEEKSLDILRTYLKRHGLETITNLIPIADLAHRNGISNEDISVASQLFQTIVNNVNNRVLENYIEKFGDNATIAIVGNGPHELGLGKGEEIDAHDIVIRLNIYNDSEKYVKDYGKKTNLCICVAWSEEHNVIFNRKLDLYITRSLFETNYSNSMRQYYKEKQFSNITTLGLSATKREIQQKYGINWPTIGLLSVYYFKNILKKNIKKSDLYGFALNHGTVLGGHYESNSEKILNINKMKNDNMHDLWMELKAMQDMFKEEGL
jgi:hypothetical protein